MSFISTSAEATYTKIYRFIHIYILKDFTVGFVHISLKLIYTLFYS